MRNTTINTNQMILLGIAGVMLILLFVNLGPLFTISGIYADAMSNQASAPVLDASNEAMKAIQDEVAKIMATSTPSMTPEEMLAQIRINAGLTDAARAEAAYVPEPTPEVYLPPPTPNVVTVEVPPTPVHIEVAPQNPVYTGQPEFPFWLNHTPHHMTPIGAMSCHDIYLEWGGVSATTQAGSRFQSWFTALPANIRVAYASLCDQAWQRGE